MNETIQHKLQLLPDSPGCYLHKNKAGTILYVGKAKNLKNRVRSYFRGAHDTKTEALVAEIADFDYIVTDSPIEALLLEINLIKENKPRYNILLKDDKSYPFIRITRERHPRLLITRQIKKDGSHYFGPYPDVGAANQTLKLLDRLYPFRKCKLPEHQFCLYYHLGQCLAHGEQLPSLSDYDQMTREVAQFLTGKDDQIVKDLQVKMQEAVSQLAFEKAAEYRDLLEAISTLRTKQRVMAHDLQDRDVFGYYVERGWMCVQVFFVRQGKLIERAVQSFPYYNDAEEDFLTFLGQFYSSPQHLLPAEILIPKAIDKKAVEALVATKVRQPQRGEKKQLVQLAIKNARVSLEQQFSLKEKSQAKTHGAIVNLGRALGIPTPFRIEAFDNSNTMGTNPVSAMVVFEGGKPNKKEYRKYKIKTVTGPDDYATMREVLRRRYGRMLREGQPQPDLIVIDGGAGQVGVAREVLYEELGLSIPLAGLQKNDRHQTQDLLYGDPLRLVPLSRQSEEFFLLHRIQEEVHRFAVSFHRQVRSKTSFSSRLDGIPGLGPKRKQALLKQFKTLSSIQKAEIEDLTAAGLPFSVAQAVQDHLGRD